MSSMSFLTGMIYGEQSGRRQALREFGNTAPMSTGMRVFLGITGIVVLLCCIPDLQNTARIRAAQQLAAAGGAYGVQQTAVEPAQEGTAAHKKSTHHAKQPSTSSVPVPVLRVPE